MAMLMFEDLGPAAILAVRIKARVAVSRFGARTAAIVIEVEVGM